MEAVSTQQSAVSQKEWRCFFCDELFTDEEAAHDHFGDAGPCASDIPGCVDPLRHDEKERLKELRDAREYARECQEARDEAEDDLALFEGFKTEMERLFGTSSPHQAWLKLEAAQNEAQMWKAKCQEAA